MIGGGELRVDPDKIAAINHWAIPISLIEGRNLIEVIKYLRKLITNFSAVATPLHAMTTKGRTSIRESHNNGPSKN